MLAVTYDNSDKNVPCICVMKDWATGKWGEGMKRNDVLRFIISHRSFYKFFSHFRWHNNLVIKRAREIIQNISDSYESEE